MSDPIFSAMAIPSSRVFGQTRVVGGGIQGKVVLQVKPPLLCRPPDVFQVRSVGGAHVNGRQVQPFQAELLGFVHQAEDVPDPFPGQLVPTPVLPHAVQVETVGVKTEQHL